MIAVGVGLVAMVFALADPVLRKLPYADPDRLVSIRFGLPRPGVQAVLRVRSILPRSFLLPQVNRTAPVDALVVLPVGPVIRIEGMSSQALDLVARMRAGVTPQIVEAALNVSMAPVGRRVLVVPLSTALNTRLRGLAIGALLASGLVVLVCWTNVFSMAVTRGLYRRAEIATRCCDAARDPSRPHRARYRPADRVRC